MCQFEISKKYKFNTIAFIIQEGIDSYDRYKDFIDIVKDKEFIVTEDNLISPNMCCLNDWQYINAKWCYEVNNLDICELGIAKDTYGSDTMVYLQDNELKTKHISLYNEMINKY